MYVGSGALLSIDLTTPYLFFKAFRPKSTFYIIVIS